MSEPIQIIEPDWIKQFAVYKGLPEAELPEAVCLPVTDIPLEDTLSQVLEIRTALDDLVRLQKYSAAPLLVAFGKNLRPAIKAALRHRGVPTFEGFDDNMIVQELERLTERVKPGGRQPTQEAATTTSGIKPTGPEVTSKDHYGEYQAVVAFLQPEGQTWQDREA